MSEAVAKKCFYCSGEDNVRVRWAGGELMCTACAYDGAFDSGRMAAALSSKPATPQAQPGEPMDKGPWRVIDREFKASVSSEDFEHDVLLRISGDFGSQEQRVKYADWLCATLNARAALASQATPGEWLEEAKRFAKEAKHQIMNWPGLGHADAHTLLRWVERFETLVSNHPGAKT